MKPLILFTTLFCTQALAKYGVDESIADGGAQVPGIVYVFGAIGAAIAMYKQYGHSGSGLFSAAVIGWIAGCVVGLPASCVIG